MGTLRRTCRHPRAGRNLSCPLRELLGCPHGLLGHMGSLLGRLRSLRSLPWCLMPCRVPGLRGLRRHLRSWLGSLRGLLRCCMHGSLECLRSWLR